MEITVVNGLTSNRDISAMIRYTNGNPKGYFAHRNYGAIPATKGTKITLQNAFMEDPNLPVIPAGKYIYEKELSEEFDFWH